MRFYFLHLKCPAVCSSIQPVAAAVAYSIPLAADLEYSSKCGSWAFYFFFLTLKTLLSMVYFFSNYFHKDLHMKDRIEL